MRVKELILESQRIDTFELWCWRRLFKVPWTACRSNQLILREINPEYSLEWLLLKQKLQFFGHLMWKADSLEKTLMLGKIEGKRRSGLQSMKLLDGIIDWMDVSLNKLREIVKDEEAWRAAVHRVTTNRTQLSEWTATTIPWSILRAGAPGWQRGSCLRLWFQLGKQEPDWKFKRKS